MSDEDLSDGLLQGQGIHDESSSESASGDDDLSSVSIPSDILVLLSSELSEASESSHSEVEDGDHALAQDRPLSDDRALSEDQTMPVDLSLSEDLSLTPFMSSSEALDSSFKESVVTSSPERNPSVSRKRKRGGFKKGLLKRRKGVKKSGRTTDAEQSENYDNLLVNVLSNEISEGEDSVSTGYSTLPPSDVGEEDVSYVEQEEGGQGDEVQSMGPTTKNPRKRKSIGRKNKYSWKTGSHSKDTVTTKDVGTSVDEELGRNSLGCLPLVQENFALISDYLKFILPDPWTISILKESIIISEIMKPENPVIKKAISWSVEGMKILVVGMPLAPSHLLWQLRKPDIFNCGSVADYLTRVANSFALLNVCTGVLQYEELWEKCSEGVVQKSFDVPCLRHSSCFLLLGGQDICKPCNNLRKKLYDRVLKASSSAASDGAIPSTTNIKYLDKEELVQKIGKLQKEKKYYKERVKRLEERIAKLIKEKSERIDSELSADFVDIMNKNADKMTPFQKMFWQQQSLALSKSSAKGIRWHPAMIRLALHLRMLSPTAYDFLRGIISLPSQRRLFDYSQSTDVKEGVQQELLDEFSKTIEKECPEDHQKNFYLLLDEMSIRSDLVYNSRTGDLVGFTNLSSVENVLKELEDEMKGMKQTEKKLAKKVLVFMLTGATSDIRFVPAVFSTDDLSAAQLFSRTWDVVYSVEETGAKVIAVILDGASVNRKFLTMNFNFGNTKFVHVTMNVASGDCRPLYFMVDPPHLIKTFRNCLANSFSHRGSRTLWKNGQQLSWKAIEALYEITKNDKFKTTKLTKAHTKLSSFSCMKVILAVQVLSKSVAEALLRNKDNPLLKDAFSQELVDFILIMNRTFDCLNGGVHSTKKNINSDLNEYFSLDDPRFQFLEETVLKYLQDWENDVSRRKGFTKEQRSKMMISFQSMEALKITIHSFVHVSKFLLSNGTPSVSSRRMNQDPLEQYFSILRRCGGSNENPNLKGVLHTRQSLHNQGPTFLAGGSRGNTEVFKRQLEVDETPLPSRKRSKQE